MMKENCRTLALTTRVFTPKQNEKGHGDFREVYEVDKARHKVLWSILLAINNPKVKGEWRDNDESGLNQENWKHNLALLNEILIEFGVIPVDSD